MEKRPLFSIIIPVYNVENAIERCARSLFEQSIKEDIEFIFVDDASPDNSIEVLEKIISCYPEISNNVKIIHHSQNKGLPDARHTGWNMALGDYIANCDSDDWFETNAFELIKRGIEESNADIISFDWFMEFFDETRISRFTKALTNEQVLHSLLDPSGSDVSMSLWGRVIRRNIIVNNNLRAKSGMTAYEDLVVVFESYYLSENNLHLSVPLYHYNQTNVNSMSNRVSMRKIESSIKGVEIIDEFLNRKKDVRLDKELTLMKLNVKMPFISDKNFYDNERWKNIWPHLDYRGYPSKWLSICLILESNNLSIVNKVYLRIMRATISLYRRIFRIKRKS